MSNIQKIYDEKLQVKYSVVFSSEEVNKKIDAETEKQQQQIKLDGFRKGKVPLNIIKERFFVSLLNDTAHSLIESTVEDLVKENNYELITRPEIKINSLDVNKDLDFEITYNLYPKVPEFKYEDINLKKYKISVSDDVINKRKDILIKSRTIWTEQDENYVSKNGDRVKIDFVGKIDNVPFDGGTANDYNLELGSKSFIDNFEDQLIGKKKNDEVEVKVKFPDDYNHKNLAGKDAVFDVKIKSVSISTIPELTAEFIKENFHFDSIEEFENSIKSEFEKIYDIRSKTQLKSDVFVWLKTNVKFDLPDVIIDEEFNKEWKVAEEQMKKDNLSEDEKKKKKEEIKKNSEESARIGLILFEIGKANHIELKNSDVNEEIRKLASAYPGQEGAIVNFYTKNKNALNQLTSAMLEDKVVDFIVNKANITETEISFEDFEKLEQE